jgi:hypothetical protein
MLNATNTLFKNLSSLLLAQGKRYLQFLHFRVCSVMLKLKIAFLYTTTITTTAASTTTITITTTTTTNKVHFVGMSS